MASHAQEALFPQEVTKHYATADDIDWFVPHQANKRILDGAARKLGLAPEKIVITVDKHANTSAASIPIALCEAIQDGRVKAGDTIVLASFGAGLSWAVVNPAANPDGTAAAPDSTAAAPGSAAATSTQTLPFTITYGIPRGNCLGCRGVAVAFTVLKWAGALYLIGLGIVAIARSRAATAVLPARRARPGAYLPGYASGAGAVAGRDCHPRRPGHEPGPA